MRDRFLSHGRGLLLTLIGVAAIVWLAATGQLGLYIHPRYFAFTIVMAVFAGVAAIVAAAVLPRMRADDDAHDHDHGTSRAGGRWALAASAVLVVVAAAALVVVPPTTLTTSAVEQRDLNASAAVASADAPALVAGDGRDFGVKDWAGLLRQGADAQYLAKAAPDITGFVTPDPDDPDDIFYVARFLVTCCAVDAQPIGVPVYRPGWSAELPVDGWVRVTGSFVQNPSPTSMLAVVIQPTEVARIDRPADPYVY